MVTNEFLKVCKRTETDETFSREIQTVSLRTFVVILLQCLHYTFLQGLNRIKYDFTQHYTKEKATNGGSPASAVVL